MWRFNGLSDDLAEGSLSGGLVGGPTITISVRHRWQWTRTVRLTIFSFAMR